MATAALGQTDGSVAAIQCLWPLRPPPQTYSSHTYSHEVRWVKCLAQGHHDHDTSGKGGDRTAPPPNIGQPALLPEPRSPHIFTHDSLPLFYRCKPLVVPCLLVPETIVLVKAAVNHLHTVLCQIDSVCL